MSAGRHNDIGIGGPAVSVAISLHLIVGHMDGPQLVTVVEHGTLHSGRHGGEVRHFQQLVIVGESCCADALQRGGQDDVLELGLCEGIVADGQQTVGQQVRVDVTRPVRGDDFVEHRTVEGIVANGCDGLGNLRTLQVGHILEASLRDVGDAVLDDQVDDRLGVTPPGSLRGVVEVCHTAITVDGQQAEVEVEFPGDHIVTFHSAETTNGICLCGHCCHDETYRHHESE